MREGRWWLKEKKFKKVGLLTLCRLGLLYTAQTGKSAAEFLLWLEEYIEDTTR